jgi:S1-C subfamily serine protease
MGTPLQPFAPAAPLRLSVALIAALALGAFAEYAFGQTPEALPRTHRTNGRATVEAFQRAAENAMQGTVEILQGDHLVALGTVVASSGLILSKASELPESPTVRLPDNTESEAEIVGKDSELDVALLRISGKALTPIQWATGSEAELGQWVVAPGQGERPWVGVVGAARRSIARAGGAMGIRLSTTVLEETDGVRILEVYPNTAAEAAGLEEGDVIRSIDGEPTLSSDRLIELVKRRDPGDTVRVRLQRGAEELEYQVTLGYRSVFDPFDRNQRMSGRTSQRRAGFKEVIQHTIPLAPNVMGGPLANLNGETIGVNIARVDRVTTYALPSGLVREAIQRLEPGVRPDYLLWK